MFKKIYVLLFLLLIIFLSIISVNASNELQYNETEVEYAANTNKSNIDISADDKLSDNTDDGVVVDTNITLSLQQGDKIEIVFDKQYSYSYYYCYINEEMGYYDSNSYDDEVHVYIPIWGNGFWPVNVGMNTLTVEYFSYYPVIVEKVSSNLIKFKTMDLNETNHDIYFYNFNLNITKKQEKTISITNIMGNYYDSRIIGYDCKIFFKLSSIDDFLYRNMVQLFLSKNGKTYYKNLVDFDLEDKYNNHFSIDFGKLIFDDGLFCPGVYDLTLVNYDGTNDTWAYEFKKEQWNITFGYNVINNTILFQFNYFTFINYLDYSYNLIIKLSNITKSIPGFYMDGECDSGIFTVLFDNLDDGVYDVVIEIPGNEFIEDFLYTTQIEIGNKTNNTDDNINSDDIIGDNNVTNDTVISLINITGDSDGNSSVLILGNEDIGNLSVVSGNDVQEHYSDRKENNFDDFNNEYVSDYGDLELTDSMHSVDNTKSYEISEKTLSKSIDDLLTKLGVIIFSCISLMVGYVRFEKNQ